MKELATIVVDGVVYAPLGDTIEAIFTVTDVMRPEIFTYGEDEGEITEFEIAYRSGTLDGMGMVAMWLAGEAILASV